MPPKRAADYQLDPESHFYKYRDADGKKWWWVCTCSQQCWDGWHYRSLDALKTHQTNRGQRDCCPVDNTFEPPVHHATVVVQVGGIAAKHIDPPVHATCAARAPASHPEPPGNHIGPVEGPGNQQIASGDGGSVSGGDLPLMQGHGHSGSVGLVASDGPPPVDQWLAADGPELIDHNGVLLLLATALGANGPSTRFTAQ